MNYDFHRKKKSNFQTRDGITSIALKSQVIQEEKWTPFIVEKRQKELLILLMKAWYL